MHDKESLVQKLEEFLSDDNMSGIALYREEVEIILPILKKKDTDHRDRLIETLAGEAMGNVSLEGIPKVNTDKLASIVVDTADKILNYEKRVF